MAWELAVGYRMVDVRIAEEVARQEREFLSGFDRQYKQQKEER